MIALVRKEFHLSLDVVRPVAIIAFAALIIGPLAVYLAGQRFFPRTPSPSEMFLIIGYGFVVLMPLIGAALACVHTVGDERHGARAILTLLPLPLGTHATVKFLIGAALTVIIACIAPWLAWGMAHLVAALETSIDPGSRVAMDSLGNATLASIVLGAIGFAAAWGASGLGRPLTASLGFGVLGASVLATTSIGIASLLVDRRYGMGHDPVTKVGMVVLVVAIAALFVAGTIPRFGVSLRWRVASIIVLAVIVIATGPVVMYRAFLRPAWDKGLVAYAPEVLATRDVWWFVERLSNPEPGYVHYAAGHAVEKKIRGMEEIERRAFFDALVHEIGNAKVWTPRIQALMHAASLAEIAGPPGLIERIAASLDGESSPGLANSLFNSIRWRTDPSPIVIEAIERYWRHRSDEVLNDLQPELDQLRTRAAEADALKREESGPGR